MPFTALQLILEQQIATSSMVTGLVMPFTALQLEALQELGKTLKFRYRTSHAVYGIATQSLPQHRELQDQSCRLRHCNSKVLMYFLQRHYQLQDQSCRLRHCNASTHGILASSKTCYRTSHAVYGIAKLNIDDKSPCGADPRGLSYTRFHGNFAMMECAHPAIL